MADLELSQYCSNCRLKRGKERWKKASKESIPTDYIYSEVLEEYFCFYDLELKLEGLEDEAETNRNSSEWGEIYQLYLTKEVGSRPYLSVEEILGHWDYDENTQEELDQREDIKPHLEALNKILREYPGRVIPDYTKAFIFE